MALPLQDKDKSTAVLKSYGRRAERTFVGRKIYIRGTARKRAAYQLTAIVYLPRLAKPRFPVAVHKINLAWRLNITKPGEICSQSGFALGTRDLRCRVAVNLHLIASRTLKSANQRLGLKRARDKDYHADHQGDRREKPQKYFDEQLHKTV